MSSQEIHLISKENGESDERLYAVAAWRDSSHFTDDERASLALTEAITRLSDREDPVPDSIWDEATRHYDETALAALILSIATTNLWCLLTACGCCLKAAYACLWQVQFYAARVLPISGQTCNNRPNLFISRCQKKGWSSSIAFYTDDI